MMDSDNKQPLRVLITKIGFDGHDRGSRIVASYLRDAGMEVIYTPPWQSIEAVTSLAIQEDVDLIGLSSLATDHLIVPDLLRDLEKAGLGEIPVLMGGIIPKSEQPALLDAGVRGVLEPGASRDEITQLAIELADECRQGKQAIAGA